MIRKETDDYTALFAENGFLVTNGEIFATCVYLMKNSDEGDWYETSAIDDETYAVLPDDGMERRDIWSETDMEVYDEY